MLKTDSGYPRGAEITLSNSKHAPAKPVSNMVCSYVRSLYVILMCVCVPLVGAPLIVCNLKAVRPSVSLTSRVCLTGHMSTNCRFPKHPHFAGAPPGTFSAARIFLSACLPGMVGFLMMLISCLLCQHTAPHCNTSQHTATHCNTLFHTAHTAIHCSTL